MRAVRCGRVSPLHTCCPENRLEERFICKWFSAATREEEGYLLDFVKERVKCMLFACPVPLIPGRGRSPGRGALLPAGMCWSPGSPPLGLTDVPISQRARDAASGLGHAAHRTGRGPVLPVSVRVRVSALPTRPHSRLPPSEQHRPGCTRPITEAGHTFPRAYLPKPALGRRGLIITMAQQINNTNSEKLSRFW